MTLFTPDDPDSNEEATGQRRRRRWTRGRLGRVLLVSSLVATLALALTVPVPFAIEHPGPWWNTLGTNDTFADCTPEPTGTSDKPLIVIEGAQTYPTTGALDLLTVCLDGTPEYPPTWGKVIAAYLDPTKSVIPFEYVFPSNQTQEQRDQENATAMVDSQSEAVAAALTHLGYDVTSGVTVAEVVSGRPADGVLKVGDVIVAVDGDTVSTISELRNVLQSTSTSQPVELTIRRGDASVTESVALNEVDGSKVLGIVGQTAYTFPFKVTVNLDDVGGPSAGMMFTLGIIDKLTPGSLTGGKKIAGTGTIDAEGVVGPIGGIRQKMYSAVAAGATSFLAPADDCGEVVGHIPAGLRVFSVSSLDEALTAVSAIATGEAQALDALPTCH